MNWPEVRLGDICEFSYGKSLPAPKRAAGKHRVFGSNGQVGFHNAAITTGPTIVIGRKGSFGETNYSDFSCWPIDTTYYIDNSSLIGNVDLRWLYHRISALGLTNLNRAAAVPGLNREDAYRLKFLLPPVNEQQRIAAVLDQVDTLREQRRKAITILDELTQSIFIDMFGKPATNSMGWKTRPLKEVGNLDRGVSKHRPRNDPALLGGPHPLIQTGDVARSNGYIKEFKSTYSDLGLAQSKLWPSGTLCITIAANIAKTGILRFSACFPDSVVGFSASPDTTEFVRIWLSFLQQNLEASAPESAQKNINLKILGDLQVIDPPEDKIRTFASRVREVQSMKETHQAHLAELDALFASLQWRAFRGELWETAPD